MSVCAPVFCSVLFSILPSIATAQIRTTIDITSTPGGTITQQASSNIEEALARFQQAYNTQALPDLASPLFTAQARAAILELWDRAPFRCIYTHVNGPMVRRASDGLFEFRGVTVHLMDRSGNTFTEEALFVLTSEGVITDFRFGLDVHRYQTLMEERKTVEEFTHRQIILDFIDNFKTAYNRKDLSFLENVFSNNALIIVGRVIQPRKHDALSEHIAENIGTDQVEFIKVSKRDYLSRLTQVFQRNEFIKVDFEKIRIHRHATVDGIYGVQLFQHWYSYSTRQAGYKDEGYLFLMVDLRNIDEPMIHVRTWQPKAYTDDKDIIDLGNFRIVG